MHRAYDEHQEIVPEQVHPAGRLCLRGRSAPPLFEQFQIPLQRVGAGCAAVNLKDSERQWRCARTFCGPGAGHHDMWWMYRCNLYQLYDLSDLLKKKNRALVFDK
jgi:hypothetical protein